MLKKITRSVISALLCFSMLISAVTFPTVAENTVTTVGAPGSKAFIADATKLENYTKLTFGLKDRFWYICGVEDNAYIMLCDTKNGFTMQYGKSGCKSYEESVIDKAMLGYCNPSEGYFTQSEIDLMKEVSIDCFRDNENISGTTYSLTRKLYAPSASVVYNGSTTYSTNKIDLGSGAGSVHILFDEKEGTENPFVYSTLWLRTLLWENYALSAYNGTISCNPVIRYNGKLCPVFHLDFASEQCKITFASLATAGTENASINENDIYTLRYADNGNISYSARYNTTGVDVSSIGNSENEFLYVQWSENGVEKVKSIALTSNILAEDYRISAEEIGGEGFTLNSSMKIWVEKFSDNLAYAKEAILEKEEGPDAPELSANAVSKNSAEDGSIDGLNPEITYEYSADGMKTWVSVEPGSKSITGLKYGDYYVRIAETVTNKPGKWKLCTVPKRFDVTIDTTVTDTTVKINGKEAAVYFIKAAADLAWTFTGKTAYGSVSKAIGPIVDAISGKFDAASGQQDATYKEVKALQSQIKALQGQVEALNLSLDKQTQEIIGAINTTKLVDALKSISEKAATLEVSYYNTGEYDKAISAIDDFYKGLMSEEDESLVARIDGSMHYFFSSDYDSVLTVSPMTNSDYLNPKTYGRKFLNDFLIFGNSFIANEALTTEGKKDIFKLFEAVNAYEYNFNSQTFEAREAFNENAFNFYEKGYAVLATAITYELTNHKNQLGKIEALETARDNATGAEREAIEAVLNQICVETKALYKKEKDQTLAQVKALHQDAIDMDQRDLDNLNKQYKQVVEAKQQADEKLEREKEEYNGNIVYCYRNGVKYDRVLKYVEVNYDYLTISKSDALNIGTYFNYFRSNRYGKYYGGNREYYTSKTYDFYDLYDLKSPYNIKFDREKVTSVFKNAITEAELLELTANCNNRKTTIEEQLQEVFSYQEYTVSGKGNIYSYSDFSTNEASNLKKVLGVYCDGYTTATENVSSKKFYVAGSYYVEMSKSGTAELDRYIRYRSTTETGTTTSSTQVKRARHLKWNIGTWGHFMTEPTEVESGTYRVLVLCEAELGRGGLVDEEYDSNEFVVIEEDFYEPEGDNPGDDPVTPQTGDFDSVWAYVIVAIITSCIIRFALLYRKKASN